MHIVYVHHANRKKSKTPSQNDDITELGVKDCELVAELLKESNPKRNFKAIYTSPFLRCKKTAKLINKYLEIPIIEDERLNEFKSVENESWKACQTRVQNCLIDIINSNNNSDSFICVTSGVNLAAFTNLAYGIKPNESAPMFAISNCCPIEFEYNKEDF